MLAQRHQKLDNRLGSGNLLVAVRSSFRGTPCAALKRHFIGCERQLIGLAELMAARDPERFVWIKFRSWQKHAQKRDGTLYSKSHIWHRLQILESLGLLLPACRYRSRAWRNGFVVTRHEDVARIEGEHCVLMIEKSPVSLRRPGEKRSDGGYCPTASLPRRNSGPNREQHGEQYQEQQQPHR
jgi:hypothetical protein